MGYFSHIILALITGLVAEAGFESGWRISWAILLLLPLPHLFSGWIRRRSLLGRFREVATGTRLLAFSPPILHVIAVCVFGWGHRVGSFLGTDANSFESPELAVLLGLLPYIAFEFIAIDARARLFATIPSEIKRLRNFQYRMFLSGLLPLLIYMSLAGVLALDSSLRAHVEEIALFHALFAAVSIGIFAFALPAILRNTWETAPLADGVAHSVLTDVARRANFECKRLLVWKTGHQISNAAIIGFHRRHRAVLFSDALLAELQPRELAAVFAHEIGHARRRHVLVFAAWTLGFFLFADLALSQLPWTEDLTWITAGILVAGVWYAGFGYLSRRFELDADLESLAITGDGEALITALENVGGAHARDRSTWRHFSTAKRVNFLRAAIRDADVGHRLRRTLTRWSRTGVVIFVLAFVAEIASMGLGWSEDRIAVDLRLGRYGSALARVEQAAAPADLEKLVRMAAEASDPAGTIKPAELTALTVRALSGQDTRRALALLELAARRGLEPAGTLYHQLRDALGSAADEAAARQALATTLEALRR